MKPFLSTYISSRLSLNQLLELKGLRKFNWLSCSTTFLQLAHSQRLVVRILPSSFERSLIQLARMFWIFIISLGGWLCRTKKENFSHPKAGYFKQISQTIHQAGFCLLLSGESCSETFSSHFFSVRRLWKIPHFKSHQPKLYKYLESFNNFLFVVLNNKSLGLWVLMCSVEWANI